ncbi:MAG: tetratricopeptide repeat protein [Clostridium sp.]|nr:tetratricopeptide repeat protein [Prevotella sp.]MCM1428999.1 tetratricopeptide repeat protein [Clostridium sp.]MCM1475471.1 tetratricopeptide repeat protein [Muribaculaceae bacterium]
MASENKHDNTEDQTAIENLNSTLTSAGEKVAANKKIIWWGIGIVAVVAAFIMSYLFIYRNPRLNNSWEAYNKVQLQTMRGELNDSTAAVQYQKVADEYSGTNAGACAALAAAESFYDLGKYDQAIKYLDKFDVSEPVIMAQSRLLLGDCYVNKGAGSYSKAIEAYQEAISKADGNPQIVPIALIKEANVYDAQKKYDKALECYTTIKNSYPEFQFGNGMNVDAYIERENSRLGK